MRDCIWFLHLSALLLARLCAIVKLVFHAGMRHNKKMMDLHQTDWLDAAMRLADIRTGELAKASGISRSQIKRIRNGMAPRLPTLLAIQAGLASISRERSDASA